MLLSGGVGVAGGMAIGIFLTSPLSYVGAAVVGMVAGSLGARLIPVRPRPEWSIFCHEGHGLGWTPLHMTGGHVPRDPQGFERRVELLRDGGEQFDEAAYRCMGPDRYWRAIARELARQEAEGEAA